MSYFSKVSSKGWIVIPKDLRDKYNIVPGNKVLITEEGERLAISSLPKDPITAYRGLFKDIPLVDELKKAKQEEVDGEELCAGQLRSTDVLPG